MIYSTHRQLKADQTEIDLLLKSILIFIAGRMLFDFILNITCLFKFLFQ